MARLFFAFSAALLLLACGPPVDLGVVGGECRENRDCAERCLRGGKYPDGTCSISCRDDRDCPIATWCVEDSDGVCLLECFADEDCRPGYKCKQRDREGASGKIGVCID